MSLSMKQKWIHKEQNCGCQGGRRWWRDALGVWDWWMQTIT